MVSKVMNVRRAGLALSAVLGALAGCQTSGTAPKVAVERAAPTRLGVKQVADVEIAAARVLEKRGEPAQALAKYREALQRDPSRGDAALRAAVLLDRQGKFDEARAYYDKAWKARPDNADVPCCLGYSLYLQQHYPEAEAMLRKALAMQPDHVRAHNNLGLVLAQTGKPEQALAAFRKGGCSEADARTNIAFALSMSGDLAAARTCYLQALAHDPKSEETRQRIQEIDVIAARAREEPDSGVRQAAATEPAQ